MSLTVAASRPARAGLRPYAQIARICLPKDYVRLRLTGSWAIDVADASGTLLFDVAGRRWSDEVVDLLAIPRDWLPPALESQEISGETARGVPVAAGAGDQQAAALGVGFAMPEAAPIDCDFVFHTSATAEGLTTALNIAAEEATIIELSWYGSGIVAVPLGGVPHSTSATE